MRINFYEQDGITIIADAKHHTKQEESEFVRLTTCKKVSDQLELTDTASCQRCKKNSCVVNLHR